MIYNLRKLLRRGFSVIASNDAISDMKLCNVAERPKTIIKTITFAIVGNSNAGKSTLINAIVGRNICAASSRPQTTLECQQVFHVQGDTQIVLLDTPGIVSQKAKKKFHLKEESDVFNIKTVIQANLVGVVVDASLDFNKVGFSWPVKKFIMMLPNKTEILLILNKVDAVKNKICLLNQVDIFSKDLNQCYDTLSPRHFSHVFMISALKRDGTDTLVEYICSKAQEKIDKNYKSPGELSGHPDNKIVEQIFRATSLEYLKHNVPYDCSYEVNYMKEDISGIVNIVLLIRPRWQRIKTRIQNSSQLDKITSVCEEQLKKYFGKPVLLVVKVGEVKAKKEQ